MHHLVRAAVRRAKSAALSGKGAFVEVAARDVELMRAYGRGEELPPEPTGLRGQLLRERAVAVKRSALEELVAQAEARAFVEEEAAKVPPPPPPPPPEPPPPEAHGEQP